MRAVEDAVAVQLMAQHTSSFRSGCCLSQKGPTSALWSQPPNAFFFPMLLHSRSYTLQQHLILLAPFPSTTHHLPFLLSSSHSPDDNNLNCRFWLAGVHSLFLLPFNPLIHSILCTPKQSWVAPDPRCPSCPTSLGMLARPPVEKLFGSWDSY